MLMRLQVVRGDLVVAAPCGRRATVRRTPGNEDVGSNGRASLAAMTATGYTPSPLSLAPSLETVTTTASVAGDVLTDVDRMLASVLAGDLSVAQIACVREGFAIKRLQLEASQAHTGGARGRRASGSSTSATGNSYLGLQAV